MIFSHFLLLHVDAYLYLSIDSYATQTCKNTHKCQRTCRHTRKRALTEFFFQPNMNDRKSIEKNSSARRDGEGEWLRIPKAIFDLDALKCGAKIRWYKKSRQIVRINLFTLAERIVVGILFSNESFPSDFYLLLAVRGARICLNYFFMGEYSFLGFFDLLVPFPNIYCLRVNNPRVFNGNISFLPYHHSFPSCFCCNIQTMRWQAYWVNC